MGTILVAYGEPGDREEVLRVAAEQAVAAGYDLLVYHVQEGDDESAEAVEDEARAVLAEVAPDVDVEVRVDAREELSDATNVSPQKRLVDAILEDAESYEYVVMGDVERGAVDELVHASMTAAVLKAHAVPVLLVPV